jgi:non-specific protein-tyrosine kinase
MELVQYIRILLKRWWLILLLALVGTGGAVYTTLQEPPIYQSTATLMLNPALTPDTYLSGSFSYISYRAAELAENYSLYLKTNAFAEQVIQEEELNISPGELIGAITTSLVERTQYFEITATRNDAAEAQILAMAIANNFIDAHMAQQQQQLAIKQAAGDVDNMQALLREKLERERQYYEDQVTNQRLQIAQIEAQPPSAARDELVASIQTQLSEYENRLLNIMSDQIALQPQMQDNQIDTITIVQPAPLPESPISTGKMQKILFALMASLVVGVTLAFGLEYLDYTVKGPDDLEALIGEPILGALSVIQENNVNREGIQSISVLAQPRASISEAFRALRTNILFSQAGKELRSLVITSAGPGEGKTTVAANLAVVMADAGKRVILVDADMRRPTLHKRFGVVNNVGLSRRSHGPAHPAPPSTAGTGGDALAAHVGADPAQPGGAAQQRARPRGPHGLGGRGGHCHLRHAAGPHRHRRRDPGQPRRRHFAGGARRRHPPRDRPQDAGYPATRGSQFDDPGPQLGARRRHRSLRLLLRRLLCRIREQASPLLAQRPHGER